MPSAQCPAGNSKDIKPAALRKGQVAPQSTLQMTKRQHYAITTRPSLLEAFFFETSGNIGSKPNSSAFAHIFVNITVTPKSNPI